MSETATVRIGILHDFPAPDRGSVFEDALRLGLEEVAASGRLPAPVSLVSIQAEGLPTGRAENVSAAFAELASDDVLAVVGPSISDNAVVARDDADRHRLPAINWSGGEQTRGPWMFHYQVGSLSEEPAVIVERLTERSLGSIAILYDDSIVGHGYREHLTAATTRAGVEIVGARGLSPTTDDAGEALEALARSRPAALVYLGLGRSARPVAVGLADLGWPVPVLANSALMFGYARPDWRDGFAGWEYIDTIADDNRVRADLAVRSRAAAAGPVGCAGYDIGRLVGEALARAPEITRPALADGLRLVKRLRAASGYDGTSMGFGTYDHGALKGDYLVVREWADGRSVQVDRPAR